MLDEEQKRKEEEEAKNYVSVLDEIKLEDKPKLTLEEKIKVLGNGLVFEITSREVLAKQTKAKNESKLEFQKLCDPMKMS